jgi:hypothetical protein
MGVGLNGDTGWLLRPKAELIFGTDRSYRGSVDLRLAGGQVWKA